MVGAFGFCSEYLVAAIRIRLLPTIDLKRSLFLKLDSKRTIEIRVMQLVGIIR